MRLAPEIHCVVIGRQCSFEEIVRISQHMEWNGGATGEATVVAVETQ